MPAEGSRSKPGYSGVTVVGGAPQTGLDLGKYNSVVGHRERVVFAGRRQG